MKKSLLFFAFASLSILGCDYVTVPLPAYIAPVVPTSDTVRKIFIEDFTGHTCPNCPGAARMLDSLQHVYPTQVIGMGVHIDFFAEPCPPHPYPAGGPFPAGAFAEDFRVTAEDADYNTAFGSNSFPLPAGLINRFGYPATIPSNVSTWPTLASSILSQPMTAYLKINPAYNSSTRALTVNITGEFMVDTTGIYKIALYLVEDSIVGYQVDGSSIIANYTFNHIFRGCINTPGSISGDTVITGTIAANTQINYTTSNSITVNSSYNDARCKIIAIIYKSSDYGVLQAAECDLIP